MLVTWASGKFADVDRYPLLLCEEGSFLQTIV
jgi:hypothetical protein